MSNTNSILQNSRNIKSIPDFANRQITGGGSVFVCLIGENSSYLNDISDMDNKLRRNFAYNRISSLPPITPDKVGFYEDKYNDWLRSFKRNASTAAAVYNEKQSQLLAAALPQILDLFRKSRKQTTDSIEKNFAMKLLFWYDFAAEDLVNNTRLSNGIKIVGENVTKIQEYLFYYMFSIMGADVLLLQNKTDLDMPLKNLNISAITVLGHLTTADIPKFIRIHTQPPMPDRRRNIPSPTPQPVGNNIRVTIPPRPNRTAAQPQTSAPQSGGSIRMTIPPHPGRTASPPPQSSAQSSGNIRLTIPAHQGRTTAPPQPVNFPPTQSQQHIPQQIISQRSPNYPQRPQPQIQKQEKNYEELANLASSVVQIFCIRRKIGSPENFQILGSGSGIMISGSGYILTNYHVAKQSHEYAVRIENDERVYFTNSLVKYHSNFDLAILRINRSLNPLPIYNGSKNLVRGQRVVAIGSPEGLFNTVSDGIISGFRTINGINMIQFTAPISCGSSGGAVLNMYGEVIGISTSGFDEGQNINFAVGYDMIRNFARGII